MIVSEIAKRAFRLGEILDAARDPENFEMDQAVESFQGMISDMPEHIVGGAWKTVVGTSAYAAAEDERVVCATTVIAASIVKPTYIDICEGTAWTSAFDEDRARFPFDGARLEIIDQEADTYQLWFYRADRADWYRGDSLTQNSESPFNRRVDEALAAMLAIRLKVEYGGETTPALAGMALRSDQLMRGLYFRPPASVPADEVEYQSSDY